MFKPISRDISKENKQPNGEIVNFCSLLEVGKGLSDKQLIKPKPPLRLRPTLHIKHSKTLKHPIQSRSFVCQHKSIHKKLFIKVLPTQRMYKTRKFPTYSVSFDHCKPSTYRIRVVKRSKSFHVNPKVSKMPRRSRSMISRLKPSPLPPTCPDQNESPGKEDTKSHSPDRKDGPRKEATNSPTFKSKQLCTTAELPVFNKSMLVLEHGAQHQLLVKKLSLKKKLWKDHTILEEFPLDHDTKLVEESEYMLLPVTHKNPLTKNPFKLVADLCLKPTLSDEEHTERLQCEFDNLLSASEECFQHNNTPVEQIVSAIISGSRLSQDFKRDLIHAKNISRVFMLISIHSAWYQLDLLKKMAKLLSSVNPSIQDMVDKYEADIVIYFKKRMKQLCSVKGEEVLIIRLDSAWDKEPFHGDQCKKSCKQIASILGRPGKLKQTTLHESFLFLTIT